MLTDAFGRTATDLRISVIDRCNLRCTYCMPADGLPWMPQSQLLTPDEIERLARIMVDLGVSAIKLTGGEPTARRELVEIVGALRGLSDDLELSMTTNGLLLDRFARPLRDAGLDRLTVSCDSLQRHRYEEMTRRDALDAMLAGLAAARAAGFEHLKINCVVIGGINDDEALAFAEHARSTGDAVRFIEYMPLDAEHQWERNKVVRSADLRHAIHERFPLAELDHGTAPAASFTFADGSPGSVGFISSVTEPFCDDCDRIRLTADGQFRSCLFALDETDLRGPLRDGADDDTLADLIAGGVARKWAGHRINHEDFARPSRSMSQIGG